MLQVTEDLRIAEEVLLLLLDSDNGDIHHTFPARSRALVFAGAALVDLALENRIDTDLKRLIVADPTPVGNELLDSIVADITKVGSSHDAAYWIVQLANRADEIREDALDRLIKRGILESDRGSQVFLSSGVSRARRYKSADGKITEEVQLRIMRTLFSDEIPHPRDIAIIGLTAACGVFESILSKEELAEVRARIDLICRLDLIGRVVGNAVRRLEAKPKAPAPAVRPASEIPHTEGLPLLGNVVGMAGNIDRFLVQEFRKHGPIFKLRALNQHFIAMVGPEANVFASKSGAKHFRSFEAYYSFTAALNAHRVMLSMDGPEHLRMRRLLVKGYSPKMLETNLDLVYEVTNNEIEAWSEESPIQIQRAMQEIITEQIGMFCTGLSPKEYMDDLLYFLAMNIKLHITKRMPQVFAGLPKFKRSKRRMQGLVEQILDNHTPEKREGKRQDFVDVLLEAHRKDPQFLPETDLFANVLAPYLVGMDTAATICAFMLFSLLKRPELLEKVRNEADEIFANGTPTPKEIRKMDVTHRVAMETLRLFPLAPALMRTVSNSFEFGGYRVPANSQIILGTATGHYLSEYFPEPERFDIDRYTRERAEHRQPGAFAPFGADRHRCIGSSMSEVQIAFTLAMVIHKVDLELEHPERPLAIKRSPAIHPDESVRMRLVRRRAP